MKLLEILLTESKFAKDEIKAASEELAKLAVQHHGAGKFVIASTSARVPTGVATVDMLQKYFEKSLLLNPSIEGFEISINQDGIPEARPYGKPAAPMSSDDAMKKYIDQERQAGRSID